RNPACSYGQVTLSPRSEGRRTSLSRQRLPDDPGDPLCRLEARREPVFRQREAVAVAHISEGVASPDTADPEDGRRARLALDGVAEAPRRREAEDLVLASHGHCGD